MRPAGPTCHTGYRNVDMYAATVSRSLGSHHDAGKRTASTPECHTEPYEGPLYGGLRSWVRRLIQLTRETGSSRRRSEKEPGARPYGERERRSRTPGDYILNAYRFACQVLARIVVGSDPFKEGQGLFCDSRRPRESLGEDPLARVRSRCSF